MFCYDGGRVARRYHPEPEIGAEVAEVAEVLHVSGRLVYHLVAIGDSSGGGGGGRHRRHHHGRHRHGGGHHDGPGRYAPMPSIRRNLVFSTMSAGLLQPLFSQFSKS